MSRPPNSAVRLRVLFEGDYTDECYQVLEVDVPHDDKGKRAANARAMMSVDRDVQRRFAEGLPFSDARYYTLTSYSGGKVHFQIKADRFAELMGL